MFKNNREALGKCQKRRYILPLQLRLFEQEREDTCAGILIGTFCTEQITKKISYVLVWIVKMKKCSAVMKSKGEIQDNASNVKKK